MEVHKPKKVLIFSFAYYPRFIGGAEVAVKEITDRLGPSEFEFHLLTLHLDENLPKEEKIGNVHIYRLGFSGEMKDPADSLKFPLHYNKYLFPFISAWKGLLLSRKIKFDFTWSIMANYSGFGALFFKLLRPDIPFLLTLQEGDPIDYIKKRVEAVYPLFKMIFTKADSIQAISHYLADFGKSMGFVGEPVVVANGVDVDNFMKEIGEDERNKIRVGLGLEGGEVALITTSRLAVKNGVGDVIKALPLLPHNIKFVIIGEGYLRDMLVESARDLGVEDRVVFKGFVHHSELPKYLKSCDIFIRPSLSEGFGNSFIEAMVAGLPTIGTPVGGIVDFLFDPTSQELRGTSAQQTGYFCKPEDAQSIADTVKRVIADPLKPQVIKNAINMCIEKYNWDKIVVQMKDVFGSFYK